MKKTMISFLCVISILISIAFALNKKSEQDKYFDNIEMSNNATHFFIKDSDVSNEDELAKFTELSKKYEATFIRSDSISEDGNIVLYKSGIYATNYFKQLDLKLANGQVPTEASEFLASFNTGDKKQSGRILNLFDDKSLIFGSLEDFYKNNEMSVNGNYTLISDTKDTEDIMSQLASFFNSSKEDMLTANYGKGYGQGTIYLLVLIVSLIVMAIFCLMSAFYPISKLKEIGVMKLLGFKNFDIWKSLNNQVLLLPTIFYFLTIPIQFLLIKDSTISYFIELTLFQFVILVIAFLFSLVMLFVIQRYKFSDMLKNFFNFKFSLYFSYLLKFLVFVSVISVLPLLTKELNTLQRDLQAKEMYEQQKEYLTLSKFSYIGDEFQSELNGNDIVGPKLANLFNELDKTAKAQYVSVSSISGTVFNNAELNTVKFKNIKFDNSDDYTIMEANRNYLENIDFNLPISLTEVFAEEEPTYLVPESLKDNFEKTELFIRISYMSSLSDDRIEDIPIKFIFYPNNDTEIFSENIDMIGEDKIFINNPIIFCINNKNIEDYFGPFLKNSPISNPLRIKDTKENRLAITKAIRNNDLEQNDLQFANVLSTGFAQELLISQSSVIVWVTILCLSIAVSILASYYIILIILTSKKKEMIVERLLGYTFYERYRNEIFYFVTIYLFGFAEILVLNRQILSLTGYLLLVVADSLIIFLMVKKHEKGALNTALKGGEAG
ncbi:DUF1430 domain-containing protein [Listeria monocytogenes]|nr:DUF1430 domain-containing protein [Listeria monocytogenes]EAC9598800.1 DUF1430 domain-containing protein [Listeria monocytogenes]EAC9622966.1 DUF1430 domain-containing protein [Listeria monocytogenes]EAC9818172.1 DUF1430 domain-containing protein [Listeria monocytogenes]EAD0163388.1 DUF1430 domain-containing protein [Listeria monocytogenes]